MKSWKQKVNPTNSVRWAGAVLLMLCLGSGCAGYRLGSTLPPDIRTVHVPPFENVSGEPLLEIETTRAILQEIQRDGTLVIAAADEADAILNVTIVKYEVNAVRFDRDRAKTAEEYRQEITAEVTFTKRKTGEVLLSKRQIRGDATFDAVGDMTTSKRTSLPECARDLAHDIVEKVVEYW